MNLSLIEELQTKRDQSLYSFQRHLITVSATVLGIMIALHGSLGKSVPCKEAKILYLLTISTIAIGILFLAIANHSEVATKRLALKALPEVWAGKRLKIVNPPWYYEFAEIVGYLGLATGLLSLAAYSIVAELGWPLTI